MLRNPGKFPVLHIVEIALLLAFAVSLVAIPGGIGRITEGGLAEFAGPEGCSGMIGLRFMDTDWILAMRPDPGAAPPSSAWLIPAALLILALAAISLDAWQRMRRSAAKPDAEYLDTVAKRAAEHMLEQDVSAKRRSATAAISPAGRVKPLVRTFLNGFLGADRRKSAREQVESELRVAREIQFGLVPARFPAYSEWREFDLYSFLSPAREVGGDYYDFFMRDASRIVFTVGDVSGKGIPAAMYMAVCRTAFRILARQTQQPGELLAKLNDMLISDNQSSMYITLACFFVDLPSGSCLYALGGHPPPLLHRRAEGKAEFIDSPRETFVGLKPGVAYPVGELILEYGDTLLLYSDGVTDATGENRDTFGSSRLRETFKASAMTRSCEDLIVRIKDGIGDFAGSREQTDDISLLAFRYWGPGGQRVSKDTNIKSARRKLGNDTKTG